jgi:hypothetical protein
VGTYTITFASPAHDLSITGATISSSGANYAVVVVVTPGTVTLSGQGYTDTTQLFTQNLVGLDPSVMPNLITITDATLVTNLNAAVVMSTLFNYFQQRYKEEVSLFSPAVFVGNAIQIDTLFSSIIKTVIEKVVYDLTGGFIGQITATGVLQ